ncbi:sensor histidine kinase [Dickeya chrysanthemi]|uniref:histidine kinase n=1 Tax=Dickeya chrysanthemi TaxID=556 RepID=A0ABU8JIV4_DICCH|nr:ATP-binding protein [Dickeya chrysanthemi]MBX9446092.1 ATP-binding protein [Dickeya chrysanthemi]MCA7006299.1 ATP-binding protein [Dickeya chrysanthemi]
MTEGTFSETSVIGLSVAEYERKLAARDKTIDVLKRRIAQEARHSHATPFAILEQNVGLEKVVARKTLELENERQELEKALTELRFTQAQLLQAQKMESIGQLAAGIAHEINTPTQYVCDNVGFVKTATVSLLSLLDSALALAEVTRGKMAEEPTVLEFDAALRRTKVEFLRRQIPSALDESLEGLGHIAKIVAAMKEFSHPSHNEKEMVDVREVINTTVTVARNEWKYVAELETRFEDDLPQLPCLRDMIGQSILNLVVNAAHAIADTIQEGVKEKGHIIVSAARNGEHMEIRIKDDGSGIPAGIRDRIFDPFFTTKAVGKGTGQGLAIVYSTVVDKHDGRIRCESEEGVGTTFILQLPLHCHKEDCPACK